MLAVSDGEGQHRSLGDERTNVCCTVGGEALHRSLNGEYVPIEEMDEVRWIFHEYGKVPKKRQAVYASLLVIREWQYASSYPKASLIHSSSELVNKDIRLALSVCVVYSLQP